MAKRYEIVANLNTTQVDVGAKKMIAGLGATERAALQMATAQEKAWDRSAKAAENAASRIQAAQARIGSMAAGNASVGVSRFPSGQAAAQTGRAQAGPKTMTPEQLAAIEDRYFMRDQKRRTDKARREEDANAKAIAGAAMTAAQIDAVEQQYLAKDYARRAAYEARKQKAQDATFKAQERLTKKSLSDEQIALAVRNKAIDNSNKMRVRAALDVAGVEQHTWSKAILQATNYETAVTKVGVAMIGLNVAHKAVDAIVSAMAEGVRFTREMAKNVIDTASALGEIANIRGKSHVDREEINRHYDVRRASGLSRERAVAVSEELENTLGLVDKKKFDDVQRKKLEINTARFIASTGNKKVSDKARAQVAGRMADFADGSADKATALAYQVDQVLSKGAGDQGVLTDQFNEYLSASTSDKEIAGMFKNPVHAARMIALTSGVGPAGESYQTAITIGRALSAFTKVGKSKGTTISQAQFLKDVRIDESDDTKEKTDKLFAYMDANLKGANPEAYLARAGFSNRAHVTALGKGYVAHAAERGKDLDAIVNAPLDVEAPKRKWAEYEGGEFTGPTVAEERAKVAEEESGKDSPRVIEALSQAREALAKEGSYSAGSTWAGFKRGVVDWLPGSLSGKDVQIESRAVDTKRRELLRLQNPSASADAISEAMDSRYGPSGGIDILAPLKSLLGFQHATLEKLTKELELTRQQRMKDARAGIPPPGPPRQMQPGAPAKG